MVKTWEKKSLLDCVDLMQGLTYSPANVKPYGLLVLRSSNIQNGALAFDDCVFVDFEVDANKYVQPNDILVCVRNGSNALIGKSCVIDKAYNATFGAFMSVLRGDETGYFAHMFASDIVQAQIRNRSSATINQITKRDFEDIIVPVPSDLNEQRIIAGALSDADAYIALLEKLIAKKCAVKQGTMQELLTGKRRLPEFSEVWESYVLEEIADLYDNLRVPVAQSLREAGDIPYYGANGIQGYVTGYTHDGEFVLVAEDGANDLTNYPVRYVCGRIWVNNHAHVLQGKTDMADTHFLAYAMSMLDYQAILVGGTRTKLNGSVLKKIVLTIPPKKEQIAISNVLFDMDAEIGALTAKLNKARRIKQGMMNELLTGSIRLPEQETSTESASSPKAAEM